jgi:uncharacterized protein (AIM24 family)
MHAKTSGTVLPVLQISLNPGDRIIAETGELAWKTPNVALRTTMAGAGSKGILGALGRAASGGGLFLTEYSVEGASGLVAFAAKVPGTIHEEALRPDRTLMVHRHGFLCATGGVHLSTGFQKRLGAGIFGGDGFLLQKVSGLGTAWVELGGETVVMNLAAGQAIDVHPGHVGMFEDSVSFDITVLPGIRNKLFGGDGFFMARLRGPGKVWLQTLTLTNLAHALSPYMGGGGAAAAEGSVVGNVAGSLLRGMIEG